MISAQILPLQVQNLRILRGERPVLQDLSFQLEAEQRLFLRGEIGSGKSTLLHALLGFVPIQQGQIQIFGTNCQQEADFVPWRGKLGLLFQHADDQLFGPTLLDDVAFGPLNQGVSQEEAYQIALRQLQILDIAHLKDRPINLLSGGEKNFSALAGVLAMQPQILLLDEPTNGLDRKNIDRLCALLQQLKLPMLIASHDENFCQRLAQGELYLEKLKPELS